MDKYLYVTREEYEKYKFQPEVLERIDKERALAHDGIVENTVYDRTASRSNYLYVTEEEYDKYKFQPEVLERIDLERALSHDGVTYYSEAELKHLYKSALENKGKYISELAGIYEKKLKPNYCNAEESAKLLNPNKDVQFDTQFIERSKTYLIGLWYNPGNRNGTNYEKIEKMLDSLGDDPKAYTSQICQIVETFKDKLDNYHNFSKNDYLLCVNCFIILSMIIEKGYKLDKDLINTFIANGVSSHTEDPYYEGYFLNFLYKLDKLLHNYIHNSVSSVETVIPNPVTFVSDVSGNEFVDVRNLSCQLINACNSNHRLSDDRNMYQKGKVQYNIPSEMPTINDMESDILDSCNYIRIDGHYGHYTKYTDIPYGKTLVVDELTGIICKIKYYDENGKTEINNPTFEDIEKWSNSKTL